MAKGEGLRDRTAAAIIESAATILGERGPASMEEIASAAGIGRATLYRHFPNREALLEAMAKASVRELAARVKEASLETVPFEEALARLARGIIATGSKYKALIGDGVSRSHAYPGVDVEVIEPIRALFRRAIADGNLRPGFSAELLMDLFTGLIRGALEARSGEPRGIEETAAAVTTVFLSGARTS